MLHFSEVFHIFVFIFSEPMFWLGTCSSLERKW